MDIRANRQFITATGQPVYLLSNFQYDFRKIYRSCKNKKTPSFEGALNVTVMKEKDLFIRE